jgi:hypothetical protein
MLNLIKYVSNQFSVIQSVEHPSEMVTGSVQEMNISTKALKENQLLISKRLLVTVTKN